VKDISMQNKSTTWVGASRISNNPGQTSNHSEILLKKKITTALKSYYHRNNNNNNNKYQQGSMNLSGFISITKSNKTNKNIFTVTKILISFKIFFIFSKNYSNNVNREIKINLAHLHAFILQCFPNEKNICLGRLICHIFSISTVIFRISTVNFSPFQGPNRSVALLPQ